MDLTVLGASLDCDDIATQLGKLPTNSLIPTSSAWSVTDAPRAMTVYNGNASATGTSGPPRCMLKIPIKRNAIVFIVQRMVPLIIMGGGALMVLNIDPSTAPAPGARIGTLLSTMVLISLKGNGGLGLGTLT